jgi:hypothetical protein
MGSPPVLKLILENTTTERIAAIVDSSSYRVRAWLKAREALRRGADDGKARASASLTAD